MSGRSISGIAGVNLGSEGPSIDLILVELGLYLDSGDFALRGTRPFHFKMIWYSQAIRAYRHRPQAGFVSSHFWRRLLQRAQPLWERLVFKLMCTCM